jgi:hypothetical protein
VDEIGKVPGKSKANQGVNPRAAPAGGEKRSIYRGDYGYGHGLSVTGQRSKEV